MYRLDFHIKDSDEEEFTDRLLSDGAGSVSTRHDADGVVISAIFSDDDGAEAYLDIASVVEKLEESIWKYRWLEDFHGYELNDQVYIYPVTSSAPHSTHYRHTIYLDPRDAFGDGRHPTTTMCLLMLFEIVPSLSTEGPANLELLDVGTGTGILSILASLLGVGYVEAIDLDATSVDMAKRNITLNRCGPIKVRRCGIEEYQPSRRFDIVAANLLYGIIDGNIDRLLDCLKPGGSLIASGLSLRWEREVEKLFARNGLTVEKKTVLKEWIAYLLKAGDVMP